MIVVDIETTGLDPKNHSILSIGAIDMNNPENKFYGECQCEEWKIVNPFALEINGFLEKNIMDKAKPTVEELVSKFIEWHNAIEDKMIAGHNVWQFDLQFLNEACWRYDLTSNWSHRTIDLHTLAYAYFETAGLENNIPLSLDVILELVWIGAEPKPHNALNGACLEAEAISRLLYGKSLMKEKSKKDL